MAHRVKLEGGPLDGKMAEPVETLTDWPDVLPIGGPGGHYVLAEREPVPFELGKHPNILLTATYRWEAE